ncbi:MAG: type II toxin-antitoxin system VapB family antitoxin [Rhizobiaceae bacterium]|nr:type II toxin-antitoxin system VapB family antitoxin [Rhizobiaceae bacterium]
MEFTFDIDDDILAKAKRFSGIEDERALLKAAFTALIEREAARQLALLGGTEPDLKQIPRRRPPSHA